MSGCGKNKRTRAKRKKKGIEARELDQLAVVDQLAEQIADRWLLMMCDQPGAA
ncbi:hypothetical protein [Prochlorococcus sp. MIT 1303]|uniref:hypothetical protein n=1 Tax=Prochlorococcus sp. MIT 1303 TaxID=1723647 RepID=UPI0007BC723A|nr:hypothetical protein [Prochlorococcus sp. MIT 1303]KZR64612.1 hypothetical protein PMIT1303_01658 [Prochlorococcus sp. MIT 1303]